MGFGDKLKGLREQAQQTVAEHKEQIQNVVETVGVAANEKTHGKYATHIMKAEEKFSAKVDKLSPDDSEPGTTEGSASADAPAPEPAAASAQPPAFADDPPAQPSSTDSSAEPPAGQFPKFE